MSSDSSTRQVGLSQSSEASSTESGVSADQATVSSEPPPRQASIDVYRGLVMFLMLAEVLHLMRLAEFYPAAWAKWLAFHTTHVEWTGCSLHDMIQPSFSFLVGVSLPFSIAVRAGRGNSFASMAWHAAWRSVVLILLGIFLRSLGKPSTNFFFVDTLTQIGLGYFLLFLIAHLKPVKQVVVLAIVLIGYWALFAFWPLPASDFVALHVPPDWPHQLSGFAAHWNKNANPAWLFDTWFMNLFPQEPPYEASRGGYCVLNFVPTLATMILGVLAGNILKSSSGWRNKVGMLLVAGAMMLCAGWWLGYFGICPVVKRIWTPSWVLYSGGICFMTLGGLYLVCDKWRFVKWAAPLTIIGANSITAYVMSWTMEKPIMAALERHIGTKVFAIAGEAWSPVLLGAAVLAVMWLILLWMYRQRVFVRI